MIPSIVYRWRRAGTDIAKTPVRTAKAFRLFISSTFRDFDQERALLQAKVFPDLDTYCASKGYQFHALDLRWGVNEEAQRDQRTAEICLGEVDAAKGHPPPNFLILVGDWYGWVPLPFAIARDEFEALREWLNESGQQKPAQDLGTVYQHDENYLVRPGLAGARYAAERMSAYTLRSRADEPPDPKDADRWDKLEAQLRRALQTAADALLQSGRIDAAGCEKYFASLTEQEIAHGLSDYTDGGATVGSGSSSSPSADGAQAIALMREIGVNTSGPPEVTSRFVEQDTNRKRRLDRLKHRIKAALPGASIVTARATLAADGQLDQAYLEHVAEQVTAKLKAAFDKHIAVIKQMEQAPDFALERERAEHHEFYRGKLKVFVGRECNLEAINSYLAGGANHPLVLHGTSGAGKSALMAQAIARAVNPKGPPVLYRFIGASAASSDFRSLFVSLVEELVYLRIAERDLFEEESNKFTEQILRLLGSLRKPAVIFLDALDQVRTYRPGWLPPRLPSGVKLVVSVLNDEAYKTNSAIYEGLQSGLPRGAFPEGAFLEIEPLRPSDGREILIALEGQERCLRDVQRDYIIRQFEAARYSPLWLRIAFEIARSWKSTNWPQEGNQVLAADTSGLITQFIDELTDIHHHERQLVTRALGYLTASKDGLSAKELTEVLSDDHGVMEAISSEYAQAKTLPPSVWVRLNRQLAPFLIEKRVDEQPLLQFFHRQVAQVARDRHYEGPAKTDLHAALADYFDPASGRRQGRANYDRRSLSELPTHLHGAQRRSRLNEILMAPDWMQQKLHSSGPRPLIDDYQYAHTQAQKLTGQTLELIAGVLARDERQLAPQLLGRMTADLADEPTDMAAIDGLLRNARAQLTPPALAPRWARLTGPGGPEIRRLVGHSREVTAVAFSPDGRHIVSGSEDKTLRLWEVASGQSRALEGHREAVRAVAFSPDGRHIVSGSEDKTVRLWEVASGSSRALEGHREAVRAVAFSPDGRHIVFGSEDKAVRLWEVASGRSRALEGHREAVRAVAFSPDGRHIVSGSEDKTVRLWEVASGLSRELKGHSRDVLAVAFSPDGRHIVSGSYDSTVRLWEVASGSSRELKGHSHPVTAVAFSPDCCHIVSGSHDHTLRLWEIASGQSGVLEGHSNGVSAVAFSPDGRHIVSGSSDSTVRLWEVASGKSRAHDEGHREEVSAVAFSPDGRHIVSGSYDSTVRLWEVASGSSRELKGHSHPVTAVAFSPDGRHIVSGSRATRLLLWEVASGEWRDVGGHKREVTAVAFSLDGRHIVSGGVSDPLYKDEALRLWEVASGRSRALEGHSNCVTSVAFSPDGRHIVSGSHDKTLRLWEVTSGRSRALEGHSNWVTSVAFSPDGRHIVSGSHDKTLRLWEVTSGRSRALEGHSNWVTSVAFSPDGRHIVSGSWDHTLRLWEVASGRPIAQLGSDYVLTCIGFAPNGQSVAGGDRRGRVHLLDVVVEKANQDTSSLA